MKAVFIRRYGGPEVLEYGEFRDPILGTGDILVKVAAASINPIDIMERSGLTKDFKPVSFPGVLGWDLSGTVVQVGPGAVGFSVGDKVLAWAYNTYAELCAVKAELLAKVPDGLDLVEAAALPLVTTTGNQLISVAADIKPGQTVLVAGGFGGVGRSALFTAKDRGARVIAGLLKKQLAAAQSLGADQVVALDDDDALDALAPVDAVANTVRGKTAEQLLGKVKAGCSLPLPARRPTPRITHRSRSYRTSRTRTPRQSSPWRRRRAPGNSSSRSRKSCLSAPPARGTRPSDRAEPARFCSCLEHDSP
jgi:NADPH:quinone reductase-like Zn-dependent oxidoreductase